MPESAILIVDDDRGIRLLLRNLLQDAGFVVRTAVDGIDALDQCREVAPALLITDINMPWLDGPGLIARLDAEDLREFPVIVISGEDDVQAHPPAYAAYALSKPIDLDRLEAHVRVLMLAARPFPRGRLHDVSPSDSA